MIPHGCTEPTEPPKYESHMRPKCARIHMKFVEYNDAQTLQKSAPPIFMRQNSLV